MKDARARNVLPEKKVAGTKRYSFQPVVMRWGIAAALVIGFGLLAPAVHSALLAFWRRAGSTVQAAEGQVYQIADTRNRAGYGWRETAERRPYSHCQRRARYYMSAWATAQRSKCENVLRLSLTKERSGNYDSLESRRDSWLKLPSRRIDSLC